MRNLAVEVEALERLERHIGYRFKDRMLLELALTHRSASGANNERLEFIGDAALGFVIAQWLGDVFPSAREHALTLMRASLIKRSTLARIAREIGLGEHLRLGVSERRSGGHQRESILADTVEAILGAVLEDGGYEACRDVVRVLYADHVAAVDVAGSLDAKTQLQELLQARGLTPPAYRVLRRTGDEHAPEFDVECELVGLGVVTRGRGGSRRDAERSAARAAIEVLERSVDD